MARLHMAPGPSVAPASRGHCLVVCVVCIFTFHFSQRHRLRLSASIWVPPFSDMLSALDSTNSSLDSPLKACFSLPKLALPRWH